MKVNFNVEIKGIEVSKLSVGQTFSSKRKSIAEEGLYLKVDANSGLALTGKDFVLAVNLETGQLRRFSKNFIIFPIETEVNFL